MKMNDNNDTPTITNFLAHWAQSAFDHIGSSSDKDKLLWHVRSWDQLCYALDLGANPKSEAGAYLLYRCLGFYTAEEGRCAKLLLQRGGVDLLDQFVKKYDTLPLKVAVNNRHLHGALVTTNIDWAEYSMAIDEGHDLMFCSGPEFVAREKDFELLNKMLLAPHMFQGKKSASSIKGVQKALLEILKTPGLTPSEHHKSAVNVAASLNLLCARHPTPQLFVEQLQKDYQFKHQLRFSSQGVIECATAAPLTKSSKTTDPMVLMGRQRKTEEEINILKNSGMNLNASSNSGFPLLFDAVRQGQFSVCKALLDHGANPNVPSRCGRNLLEIACIRAYPKIVKLLLERGTTPPASRYLIEIAAKNLDVKTIEVLAQYPKLIAQGKPWECVREEGQKSIPTYEALAAANISPFIKDPHSGQSFADRVRARPSYIPDPALRHSLEEYFLFLEARDIKRSLETTIALAPRAKRKM